MFGICTALIMVPVRGNYEHHIYLILILYIYYIYLIINSILGQHMTLYTYKVELCFFVTIDVLTVGLDYLEFDLIKKYLFIPTRLLLFAEVDISLTCNCSPLYCEIVFSIQWKKYHA